VKLFNAHRRQETTKLLQFLELMKAMFNCGGNTRQQSVGLRHHEGNSLDPRKDDFLKLMMHSLFMFFQDRCKSGLFVSYDLPDLQTFLEAILKPVKDGPCGALGGGQRGAQGVGGET
jgi:hypothetical protein